MWRPSEPSVSLASKGLVTLDIVVEGASTDLHSGRFGGTVANPLHVLSEILASLHRPDGTVAVPGFYDGIPPLTAERRARDRRLPFDETDYLAELGLCAGARRGGLHHARAAVGTADAGGQRRAGRREVHRHPAHRRRRMSPCRLVPGQDPDAVIDAIAAHVGPQAGAGRARHRARRTSARVPAYTIPASHPAIAAATAALEAVYPGQQVLRACVAGTLPATVLFERLLGVKTLFFSFSTADEKLHAPNEYLRIRRLREGMRAWEQLWRLLGSGLDSPDGGRGGDVVT